MLKIALICLAVLAALVAVALIAQHRWNVATAETIAQLEALASPPRVTVYSEAELTGLPAPVARYFRTVLTNGQPIIKRATVAWEGEFNMGKPGADKWMPMIATQVFVPGASGFVWAAQIDMAPGVKVLVRDAFVDGKGSMRGTIWGLKDVVRVEGTPQIAAAALQRYLGESTWFPTALLPSQGVAWSAIDDKRARASITAQGIATSVEMHFADDGTIEATFVPDRMFDDGKAPPAPHPWKGLSRNTEARNGMRVPTLAIAEWQLPSGAYQYVRCRVKDIQLEFASP